jgi:apolipoprotein N-acyltransferase
VSNVYLPRQRLSRRAYLLPVLSALLLILAFPPFEQGYLAWVALTPLICFCLQASPRQALAGGILFGLPLHLYLNLYLAGLLFAYLTPPLAALAVTGLVLILCCFSAGFTLAAVYFRRLGSGLGLALALPALWLIMEYARSLSFIGYNVGYLGYTQWGYPVLLNLASVYGYWGLPFVMAAFQSILVLGLCRQLEGRSLAAGALILGLLVAVGIALPSYLRTEHEKPPLWAALIQGNSAPAEILAPGGREQILQRYLEMTRQAVTADRRVDLVVWPETVVDLHYQQSGSHRPEIIALAEELNVGILYGARVRTEDQLFNSVVLLSAEDAELQAYHKQRLVPFVEYFPMAKLLNDLLNLDVLLGSYTAGEEISLLEFSGTSLAGVVCFESYFGDYTRLFARQGADHLFILTNDAWFGKTIGLEQHAQVAAIRAAEMGLGVTQVANSGITISFDHRGRELFRSGKSEPDTFIVSLDLAGRGTVYRYAGDYFPAFWLVFLVLYGVTLKLTRRNNRLYKI